MATDLQANGDANVKLDKDVDPRRDFSPPTAEEWKAAAEKALKGAPFEKKLVTKTYEGINLQPIYTADDIKDLPHLEQKPGFDSFGRGSRPDGYLVRPWEICQSTPAATPKIFNEKLTYDMKRGQTGVILPLDKAGQTGLDSDSKAAANETGKDGVAISTLDDFSQSLDGVQPGHSPLHIIPGFSGLTSLMLLVAHLKKINKPIDNVKGSIDADPLGYLVENGGLPVSLETAYHHMAQATHWAGNCTPQLKTVGVSGLPYHNAGADAVNELAYALATGVEYIDRLLERKIDIDAITTRMRFSFGIGPFYFMEIAKLRAGRMLWARIVEAYGGSLEARKMTVHGRTSLYNQTAYDPYVNMLRTTTEAFSAVVAGVDSLQTNPFNEVFGGGDEFARRVTRNTQVLLKEESRLEQLIDPAGGSYFVEKLTHEVAEKAWKRFRDIENNGGIAKLIQNGDIQAEVNAVDEKRKADIAKRKSVIIGTNYSANVKEEKIQADFPDFNAVKKEREEVMKKFRGGRGLDRTKVIDEKLVELKQELTGHNGDIVKLGAEAFLSGATIGEVWTALNAEKAAGTLPTAEALKPRRASMIFEQLRDAVEAYKTKTGSAPKLFLAIMGGVSQYKARADFSQSFFEVGGFDVIYPQAESGSGFDSPEAAVDAAIASGAAVTVICSTDDTYPDLVPPITKQLKEKNPEMTVILAGYPKDQVESHKAAGVDDFIFMGANAHKILSGLLTKLGVLS